MKGERKAQLKFKYNKIFWLILGLSGIIVGSIWLLFPNYDISTPMSVMNFFSIASILVGLYFLFYSIRLQQIIAKEDGIALREKRVRDLFKRTMSVLNFDEIQDITHEGKIIKIKIKNKRIPFRIIKKEIIGYDLFISKARENKIKIY